MSDQTEPLAGQPVQPKYITQEEAQRIATEAAEVAFRRAQGLIDKSGSTLQKKVRADMDALEKTIAAQRKSGMEISGEQEARLRQQIINEALTSADIESETLPPKSGQTAAQSADEDARINVETDRLYREYGFAIETFDPEAANLDMSSGDRFLSSLAKALDEKASRLVSKHATRTGTTVPQSPTRTPTSAGGAGAAPREDLMAQYRKEVDAAAGNPHAVLEVRRKYRGLGLPL